MDRLDVGVGLLWGSGAGVTLAAAFSVLSGGIQLVGVGTVAATSVALFKFYSDRKEEKQKKVSDMVVRLQPRVYTRLVDWAVKSEKFLTRTSEKVFYQSVEAPPDLSTEPDYRSIVGPSLKAATTDIVGKFEDYSKFRERVHQEYNGRIDSIAKRLNSEWEGWGIALRLQFKTGLQQTFSAQRFISDYGGPKGAREMIERADSVSVGVSSDSKSFVTLPQKDVAAILLIEELPPSYGDYLSARKHLLTNLRSFISKLDDIGRRGEKDWNVQ